MEVRHHSHHGKKKWTEYFWEFLMLFLAVFAGFLAENQREHMVEHQREKKYVQSLAADLKTDTVEIRSAIEFNIRQFHGMDSLAALLNKESPTEKDEEQLYYLNKWYASRVYTMTFNDGTIRQLLSSGNLRLIKEQAISDSIMSYYGLPKDDIIGQGVLYEEMAKRLIFFAEDIFDNSTRLVKMNPDSSFYREPSTGPGKLMTHERALLKKYSQMILTARGFLALYLDMLFDMRKRSDNLLHFLHSKYNL